MTDKPIRFPARRAYRRRKEKKMTATRDEKKPAGLPSIGADWFYRPLEGPLEVGDEPTTVAGKLEYMRELADWLARQGAARGN